MYRYYTVKRIVIKCYLKFKNLLPLFSRVDCCNMMKDLRTLCQNHLSRLFVLDNFSVDPRLHPSSLKLSEALVLLDLHELQISTNHVIHVVEEDHSCVGN